MNTLPQRFDLSARKGAVLGPIEVVVSGIDLTLYNLTGTPDSLAVTGATTFVMTFSATLLDSLPFGQHPGFASGNSRYWVDAALKTDSTVVVPLIAGNLNVSAKGSYRANELLRYPGLQVRVTGAGWGVAPAPAGGGLGPYVLTPYLTADAPTYINWS